MRINKIFAEGEMVSEITIRSIFKLASEHATRA